VKNKIKDIAIDSATAPLVKALISASVQTERVVYNNALGLDADILYADCSLPRPVMLYIHGGGWVQGTNHLRDPYCSRFAAAGFFVMNINYGLVPDIRHPEQLRNIFQAINFLYVNAEKYGLNITEFILCGDSAGAHLAAMAAAVTVNKELYDKFNIVFYQKDSFFIKCAVLICGVLDMGSALKCGFKNIQEYIAAYTGYDINTLMGADFNADAELRWINPCTLINKDFPPCLVISGEADLLSLSSLIFYEKLKAENIKAGLCYAMGEDSRHCYPLFDITENGKKAKQAVFEFLTEALGREINEQI